MNQYGIDKPLNFKIHETIMILWLLVNLVFPWMHLVDTNVWYTYMSASNWFEQIIWLLNISFELE